MARKKGYKKRRSVRSIVKSMIMKQEEPKRYSYAWANSGIGTSASAIENEVLSYIVAGTGANQRIGHEIRTTGFYAQFMLKYNVSATPTPQVVRALLVQAKCSDDKLSLDSCGVDSVIDPDRYVVLYDRMISLVQNGDSHFTRFTIKKKFRRKIRYDSSTLAPVTNALQLYIVSDNNTNKPSLSGHYVIHFKE